MPHRRSLQAAALRRSRAAERGYLRVRPPGGKWIAVPADMAARLQVMSKGLVATRDLETQLGTRCRNTSALAALAAGQVAHEQVDRFRRVAQAANAAKRRSWLDRREVDPLVANDPWRGASTTRRSPARWADALETPVDFGLRLWNATPATKVVEEAQTHASPQAHCGRRADTRVHDKALTRTVAMQTEWDGSLFTAPEEGLDAEVVTLMLDSLICPAPDMKESEEDAAEKVAHTGGKVVEEFPRGAASLGGHSSPSPWPPLLGPPLGASPPAAAALAAVAEVGAGGLASETRCTTGKWDFGGDASREEKVAANCAPTADAKLHEVMKQFLPTIALEVKEIVERRLCAQKVVLDSTGRLCEAVSSFSERLERLEDQMRTLRELDAPRWDERKGARHLSSPRMGSDSENDLSEKSESMASSGPPTPTEREHEAARVLDMIPSEGPPPHGPALVPAFPPVAPQSPCPHMRRPIA